MASLQPSASQRSPPSASGSKTSLQGESWWFFTFGRDEARETNVLAAQEVSPKLGGSCGVHEWAVASSSSAIWKGHDLSPYEGHHRPTHNGTILKLTTVQFVNGLRP